MIALVDHVARLLEGEVVLAAEQVERRYRSVAVARARQEGINHPGNRFAVGRHRGIPLQRDERIPHQFEGAHEHHVDRIPHGAVRVMGAAGEGLEPDLKCVLVEVEASPVGISAVIRDFQKIGRKAWDRHDKAEIVFGLQAVQFDDERLHALVRPGIDEARRPRARREEERKLHVPKAGIELLGRNEVRLAEAPGHFVSREIFGVDRQRKDPERFVPLVVDVEPHRLDVDVIERNAKQRLALVTPEGRCPDGDTVGRLNHHAIVELRRHRQGCWLCRRSAARNQCSDKQHGNPQGRAWSKSVSACFPAHRRLRPKGPGSIPMRVTPRLLSETAFPETASLCRKRIGGSISEGFWAPEQIQVRRAGLAGRVRARIRVSAGCSPNTSR